MSFFWVTVGSALGGLLRYIIARLTLNLDADLRFPVGTFLINILGSFVIAYFGTLTLQSGRHAASDNLRLFVMVGVCGGFTTFSSFNLQTFDLIREGLWGRALANVGLSVLLGLAAVGAGHLAAQQSVRQSVSQVAETREEEFTG